MWTEGDSKLKLDRTTLPTPQNRLAGPPSGNTNISLVNKKPELNLGRAISASDSE